QATHGPARRQARDTPPEPSPHADDEQAEPTRPARWNRAGVDFRATGSHPAKRFLSSTWLLGLFSCVIGANLGLRCVLPVLPYGMVMAGICGAFAAERRRYAAPVAACVVLTAVATFDAAPRFLSYFNAAAGGPAGGAAVLADSNIDWGQGLKELGEVMRAHGLGEVHLSYFGAVDPGVYGIVHRPLETIGPGGVAAVSVQHLAGISLFSPLDAAVLARWRARAPFATAGDSIRLYRY
ncbi:MAG: hypothetical protein ACU85V_00565, partial [Gammaproteobacteria bacterium]